MNTEAAVIATKFPAGWDLSVFSDEIDPDLEIQLEEVKRAGLNYFDLRTALDKNVLDLSDKEIDRVAATAHQFGLQVKCIGSPVNKHPFRPEDRSRELQRLRRIVEIAQRLKAPYIRIFSPFVGGASRAPEYEEIRDWLADQIKLAEEQGVVLLLENDGDAYGAFPENAKKLFQDLGNAHFRAVYDFSNAVLIGYPALPHWFPWILPFLEALHIKDSLAARDGEGYDQIVPAGEGEGNVPEVLRVLVDQGWKGPVSIEPHLSRIGKKRGLDSSGAGRPF